MNNIDNEFSMATYTAEELAAMSIMCMNKASYRKAEFERLNLGTYTVDNPTIKSLIVKELVSVSKSGSISPNRGYMESVMKANEAPSRYKRYLCNWNMQFKSSYPKDD